MTESTSQPVHEYDIEISIRHDDNPDLIVTAVNPKESVDFGIDKNLPQHPTLLYIASPTGAGKTNLIQWLLVKPYNQFFNKIFYFCSTMHQDSWKMIQVDKDKVYSHYTDEAFKTVLEDIKEDPDDKCLIIIDDCTGTSIFKKNNAIAGFAFNHRHYPSSASGTSIWIISHQYKAVPKQLRGVIKDMIIFRLQSGEEIEEIGKDNKGLMKMKYFLKMYDSFTKEKYNFLYNCVNKMYVIILYV